MAELAIVSSIVALLATGAKLSIGIFDFATSLGTAASELQSIGTEVTLFCSVVKQLQSTLTNASVRYSHVAINAAREIVDRCRVIFEEITHIIGGLRKSQGPELIPSVNFIARVKWTLKKSKVQLLRTTLESCKITLHIMLTTMDVARKISLRRKSSILVVKNMAEDKQDEMITQGLIMSQQSAIERLGKLEDEADIEELPVNKRLGHKVLEPMPDTAKKGTRLSRMLGGLSINTASTEAPQFAQPSREQRASLWLNSIVFDEELEDFPHPGSKLRRRFSSIHTDGKHLELLRKWTDQIDHHSRFPLSPLEEGQEPPLNIFKGTKNPFSSTVPQPSPPFPQPTTNNISIVHPSTTSPSPTPAPAPTPTPTLRRTSTHPISPKTLRVNSISMSATTAALGLQPESFLTDQTALQVVSGTLKGLQLPTAEPSNFRLCIAYGGKVRTLKGAEKPLAVVQQYAELGLEPQIFMRTTTVSGERS